MAVASASCFPVFVFVPGASGPLRGQGTELQSGAVFFSSDDELPKLFTPVRVRMELPEGEVECEGEIVRVVTAEQAAAWRMPVSCAIQFVHVPVATQELLEEAASARDFAPPLPRSKERTEIVKEMGLADEEDHYKLLGLPPDTDLALAEQRARVYRHELEAAAALETGIARNRLVSRAAHATVAGRVLGDPVLRAEYDAGLANFRGVARCIAAGLTVVQLEACRKRFLLLKPKAAIDALARINVARVMESNGRADEAFATLEQALSLDPLNLKLHLAWTRAVRLQKVRSNRSASSVSPRP
jgi:eukaryotic-like serine/threonine-protein kinase